MCEYMSIYLYVYYLNNNYLYKMKHIETFASLAFELPFAFHFISYANAKEAKVALFLFLFKCEHLLFISFLFLAFASRRHLLPPLLTSANESVPLLLLGCSRIVSARQQPRQKGKSSFRSYF